jgi:hypothetical protein
VCLFIGAGVSKSCGLPDWNELAKSVVNVVFRDTVLYYDYANIAIRNFLSDLPLLNTMRRARQHAGERFNAIVKDCLYASPITLSPTIEAIAALNVNRICCFNYDDLLEEALLKKGRKVQIATSKSSSVAYLNAGPVIFHPHGFLNHLPQFSEVNW